MLPPTALYQGAEWMNTVRQGQAQHNPNNDDVAVLSSQVAKLSLALRRAAADRAALGAALDESCATQETCLHALLDAREHLEQFQMHLRVLRDGNSALAAENADLRTRLRRETAARARLLRTLEPPHHRRRWQRALQESSNDSSRSTSSSSSNCSGSNSNDGGAEGSHDGRVTHARTCTPPRPTPHPITQSAAEGASWADSAGAAVGGAVRPPAALSVPQLRAAAAEVQVLQARLADVARQLQALERAPRVMLARSVSSRQAARLAAAAAMEPPDVQRQR